MSGFSLKWSWDGGGPRSICADPGTSDAFSYHGPAAGIMFAGVWRGDNANELRCELQLSGGASRGDLIAAAWDRWGTNLARHLRGPFSLCLVNADAQTAYLARDPFGVEPLFLARSPDHFAAANCPRAARRAAELASIPSPAMVADFVKGKITSTTATFHQGLVRVPPGTWMLISPHTEESETYWSLDDAGPLETVPDPARTFERLLSEETARSGALDDDLVVLLSGGLDSSAIAALIPGIRQNSANVSTLSMTFDHDPKWADRQYIAAMRAHLDMEHHSLPSTSHDPLAAMDDLLTAMDGPCFGYGLTVSASLLPHAKAMGKSTVLHGHGGDEIVSYGVGLLNELGQAGEWTKLWREAKGASELWSRPRWRVFERYLVHRPSWRWLKGQFSKLFGGKSSNETEAGSGGEPSIVAPEFAATLNASDRKIDPRPMLARPEHSERDLHLAALSDPVQPHALETTVLAARFHGLKVGMPFMSPQLAEFCIALPADWKLRGGYTRYILREAIRPHVPEIVANRRDKNDFTQGFVDDLLASPFIREHADAKNAALTRYVNRDWLTENWAKVERLGADISIETARGLWRAAVLGRWLAMDRDAGILSTDQRKTAEGQI